MREYHVVLTLDAQDDQQARFKAAVLERCGNEVGIGLVGVRLLQQVEVVYRQLGACERCGSLVCQGPAAHSQDEAEARRWQEATAQIDEDVQAMRAAADEPDASPQVRAATVRLEEIARAAGRDGGTEPEGAVFPGE